MRSHNLTLARVAAESLEIRRLLSGFAAHVDFEPPGAIVPSGYMADSGALFGNRNNGLTYGWRGPRPAQVVSRHVSGRSAGPDSRYDAFAVFHARGRGSAWEIAVPDGTYLVHVVAGDPRATSGRYQVDADGVIVADAKATGRQRWVEGTRQIAVSAGTLTLTAPLKGHATPIDFVDVTQVVPPQSAAPTSPTPPAPPPPTPPTPPTPPPAQPLHLTWQQEANSPVVRLEATAVTVGDQLYVFGGYGVSSPNYLATKETDSYNPATNVWTRLADMPEGLTHIGAATDGRYIYAAGGYVSNYSTGQQTFATADTWRYDTVTNQWTAFVPLPAPRSAGAMVIIGSELHYVEGNDINRIGTTDHWVLNLGDASPHWTALTPLPFSRNHIAATVVNGEIYVIGGQAGNDDGSPSSDVLKWDPANPASWQVLSNLPRPISHLVAVPVNGKILAIDGVTTGLTPLATVYEFDPGTNTWTSLADSLPSPREFPAGDLVDNRIVITTGDDNGIRAETWVSQPIG